MEKQYEKNITGEVLYSYDSNQLCDVPENTRSGEEMDAELRKISTPYHMKKLIECTYILGALSADAIVYFFLKQEGECEELRTPSFAKKTLKRAVEKGYLIRCTCYTCDSLPNRMIRYEYYVVEPKLADKMSTRFGFNMVPYLTDPAKAQQILSAAQMILLFVTSMGEIYKIKRGILRQSDTPFFQLRYKGYWKIYLVSHREKVGSTALLISELSEKLIGRLKDTRAIIICENTRNIKENMQVIMNGAKQSEIYGFYFMSDFAYQDKNLCIYEVYHTTEGMQLKPIQFD